MKSFLKFVIKFKLLLYVELFFHTILKIFHIKGSKK